MRCIVVQKLHHVINMAILNVLKTVGRNEESDECYTPINQVKPVLQYLDNSKTYYEPTSGISSNIVQAFTENGYNMKSSNGKDFLPVLRRELKKFKKLQHNWMLTL